MTLDERLEALTQSLELLASLHRDLDARERRAREALLAGIAAYLQALQDGQTEDGAQNE